MKLFKGFIGVMLIACSFFFGGCEDAGICNMTPSLIPQNQSNLYTITMAVRGADGDILQKSIKPYIIVNGEKHEMKKHPDGNNVFVYDYPFYGVGTVPFYFELEYETHRNGAVKEKIAKSAIFSTIVTDKYVFALNNNRGPVGATVGIVGSGFSKNDRVKIGSRTVASMLNSSSSIEFIVPPLECNKEYEVYLLSNKKEFLAGNFFIDESLLHCSADFIRLMNGESQTVVFMLDGAAPADGLVMDVLTDIPNSIIMPELKFMPGERSVSASVTGGDVSGKGTLFISAKGFKGLEIPVEIGDLSEGLESTDTANLSQPSQMVPINNQDTSYANDNDVVVL